MPESHLPPDELADLYDSLYGLLEALPADTHPAWELAVESVLFGGEAIAPGVTAYGEQQSERNDFTISAYRQQYGDGERVKEFPTLTTRPPTGSDRQYVDEDSGLELPVAPGTDTVLPIFVDDDTLPEAVRLLNAFPTKPGAETAVADAQNLLHASLFPGLTSSASNQDGTHDGRDTEQAPTDHSGLPPNELADLYDGLYTLFEAIPSSTHPRWKEAIESILFGGEYLDSAATPYGEQQANRNEFGMPEYRAEYGDGERVTEFPAIATSQPTGDDARHVDTGVTFPVAPDSQTVLPLAPAPEALSQAAHLLAEFPAEPDADAAKHGVTSLFDADAFTADIDVEGQSDTTESPSDSSSHTTQDQSSTPAEANSTTAEETQTASPTEKNIKPDDEKTAPSPVNSTVLRDESAGEISGPGENTQETVSDTPRKYDDPEAERAHRRAQQRDPSDVVELGEDIRLTLKQVDYSSRPPTIMGTKNRLVVFVIDAPQDLSEYETIKATVVDYGGKNNSAEAAFSGYVD